MSQYERYTSWVSSKARVDVETNDRHPGENPFERPQGQTVGRSKSVRVRFKLDTPAAPQPLYKPERPYREDKARIPRPLANYIPIHYKPGEPPTHQLRFKSGPNAQSSLSIALPTKATRGLKRRKNVKVFYPPVHKSPSPSTRQPPIPRPNFRLCSDALTESEPKRRLNRHFFVYRPPPPLYPTSIRAPPTSPILGGTVIVLVGGVVSPESTDIQAMSPVASTRLTIPPIRIRPLPPIPEPFPVPPPVKSENGTYPACSPARQRRRVQPVSMDEIDYREVITAFLEKDHPAFHDCPGVMDWRLQHSRDDQKEDPPVYCN